jgi:hypothetical protein
MGSGVGIVVVDPTDLDARLRLANRRVATNHVHQPPPDFS